MKNIQHRHAVLYSLLIVAVAGAAAMIWRFLLEERIDMLLTGYAHGSDARFEDLEFIVFSVVFVSLSIIPGWKFALHAIRQREAAQSELRIASSIVQHANEGIMVTDADNTIVFVNPAFTSISGYSASEVIGLTPKSLSSGRHEPSFYEDMWAQLRGSGRWMGEIWNRRKNGEIYAQWLSIFTLLDAQGRVLRRVGFFSDITERKKREEKIAWQATHDPLTGLVNRKHFLDRLSKEVLAAGLEDRALAVLFVDLDGFKPVNDTLGHEAGDLLLKQVARQLSNIMRRDDLVARFGGDEFVMSIRVGGIEDAERVAAKIIDTLGAMPPVSGLRVGASVGMALFPADGQDADTLLQQADAAMYAAKKAGKNTWRRSDPVSPENPDRHVRTT